MQEPLVSILIPYYNHLQFIGDTLNSISNEGYTNLEVILINDGSDVSPQALINQWQKENPQIKLYYFEQENHGIAYTLNKLIEKAQGAYLLPCASDDMLLPQTISPRVELLQKNRAFPIVISDCMVIDSSGKLLLKSSIEEMFAGDCSQYSTPKGILEQVVLHWGLAGPHSLFDATVFDTVGGYSEDLAIDDWDFYLRVAQKKVLQFYRGPVAQYRRHDGNITVVQNTYKDLSKTAFKHILKVPFPLNVKLFRYWISLLRQAYL